MQAPTPPLGFSGPGRFSGPTVPPANNYVLCYFQGPGVPWSEDPLGTSFQSWAVKNLSSNAEQQFYWLGHPGKQMNEFVTAQNTRPGQYPYVKPVRACEQHPGKSCQSSKMAVRHVWSRTEHQKPVYHTLLPPEDWNKLWVAVKVEDANPLCIKAPVSRDVSVRSHQNDRLTLFRTQELMRRVFGLCEDFLNLVSQEMENTR